MGWAVTRALFAAAGRPGPTRQEGACRGSWTPSMSLSKTDENASCFHLLVCSSINRLHHSLKHRYSHSFIHSPYFHPSIHPSFSFSLPSCPSSFLLPLLDLFTPSGLLWALTLLFIIVCFATSLGRRGAAGSTRLCGAAGT